MSTVVCQCVPLLSPSPTRGGEILFSWAGRLHGGILLALIVKIEVWTISNKLITAQCTFCVQWLHTFIKLLLNISGTLLGSKLSIYGNAWTRKCTGSSCTVLTEVYYGVRKDHRSATFITIIYLPWTCQNWRFLKNLPLAVELLPQQIGLCLKCSNVGGKGSNIVNRTSIFSQSSV